MEKVLLAAKYPEITVPWMEALTVHSEVVAVFYSWSTVNKAREVIVSRGFKEGY